MPPRRSVKRKTQTSTIAQASSAAATAPEEIPLPVPSPSSSHSTARILRSFLHSRTSASTHPYNMSSRRFLASSHVLVPGGIDEDNQPQSMELEYASQQDISSTSTVVSSPAPRTEGLNQESGDTHDAIIQPRILVPSSSSPPREESNSMPERPAPKRRRRGYSIHDESLSGPSGSATPFEVAMILQAEFDAANNASAIGPAIGEASSSKRQIPVPSTSKVEVNLVSSRSPSPSSCFAPPAASSRNQSAGPQPEPLSTYVCPICLSPPSNATLTPCGHICCGECLFTAVRSALQRAMTQATRDPVLPRCPVCRAVLKNWDGRGRGVIGLKPRVMIAL